MKGFILTDKLEFCIKLFCFIIVISLCFAVYSNGQDLDCDKCIINFESYKRLLSSSSEVYQNITIPIQDIYNNLFEEECVIIFDKDNGYIYNKDIENVAEN